MRSEINARCGQCGAPLQQGARGRTRRYCRDACRKAAHRDRQSSWSYIEANEPQLAGLPTLSDLYDAEHGDGFDQGPADGAEPDPTPSPASDEDVIATLLAALEVSKELRRHGVAARPQFAVRCAAVASALDKALAAEFGDILR